LRCSRCRHDNPNHYRYCGICGTPLEHVDDDRAPAEAPGPAPSSRPLVSGPSFLGLNAEPANPSYLLDEEESRSHRGLWVVLVLLVIAVLVGLQYRSELRARAGQLYAAAWARFRYQQLPAQNQPVPAGPGTAQPSAQEPTAVTPPPQGPAPASQPGAAPTPEVKTESQPPESQPSASQASQSNPAGAKSDEGDLDTTAEDSKTAVSAARARPAAAATSDPMLVEAQRYLHGQGVPRNCAQGLIYLRQALKKPNPAARSQMGALYATGHCVPLDRAAAYRWFTSALELDPNNVWLARERDRLYGEMSSAERRRVAQNF